VTRRRFLGLGPLLAFIRPAADSANEGKIVAYYPPLNPDGTWQLPWVQGGTYNKHLPAIILRGYESDAADLDVFATDHYTSGDHLVTVHAVPHGATSNTWS
jgi:hypothetical protein